MGLLEGTALRRIIRDRRFEDYRSLKQYFRNSICNEILWSGHQLTTNAAVELMGGDDTIAALGANDIVYVRSEADLAALDGDSIYIDYVSSTGIVYEGIESLLESTTDTSTEVPIGCEASTKYDTVASVLGETITMTGLNSAVANDLVGEYVIGCVGEQAGAYLIVDSNTLASPTVITGTTTPNANWAADTVSVQANLYNDVYRIRQMYTETEAPTDNKLYVCDLDASNIYASIQDGGTRANHARYFAPTRYYSVGGIANTTNRIDSYLGKIHASFPAVQADAEVEGAYIQVTFTPRQISALEAGGTPADVTFSFYVQGEFDWEPCVLLQRNTDVIIKVAKSLNADHANMFVEYAILEVTTI